MYNDIVTTIGRGNGDMLILLDLSAAFDHDNLFYILEKYVRIYGNTLKRIKSYFSNRTQHVQIVNVFSDYYFKIVWCSSGLCFRTFQISFLLIPLSAILKYQKIDYQVYADDTQLLYLI